MMHLMHRTGRERSQGPPGVAQLMLPAGVVHLDEPAAVFEAMLEGWARQQRSRLLAVATIMARDKAIRRFQAFSGDYPWRWAPVDVEDFTAALLSGPQARAHSTVRSYHEHLRVFCAYLTDPRYQWTAECLRRFGEAPVQVCHEWNTAATWPTSRGGRVAVPSPTTSCKPCSTMPTRGSRRSGAAAARGR